MSSLICTILPHGHLSEDQNNSFPLPWCRIRWVITIWATGRDHNTSVLAQVIFSRLRAVYPIGCTGGIFFSLSVTGAHGRFVPLGEGGVVREARTQTLEPDVWIREVLQRGHGTRRRIQLSHLALWGFALVVLCLVMNLSGNYTRWQFQTFSTHVKCNSFECFQCIMSDFKDAEHVLVLLNILSLWKVIIRHVYFLSLLCPCYCQVKRSVLKNVSFAGWRRCWWWDWEWPRVLITRWSLHNKPFCTYSAMIETFYSAPFPGNRRWCSAFIDFFYSFNMLTLFVVILLHSTALGVVLPSTGPLWNLQCLCQCSRVATEWTTDSWWQVTFFRVFYFYLQKYQILSK